MAGAAKYQPYPVYKSSGVEWLGDIPKGWEVAALKHSVSVPITDGPHETPHFIDEGIPFVSAEAVSSGHIDFNKIRSHISQKDHDRYSKKYLPAFGDIYLVKSGATTGITAIVETDEVFNIWSPLAAIRCNDDMAPKFVLHFLRSAQFQEAIRLYWSFGTQQNIGMKVIENLQTAVPCKQEQTQIAAFLDYETAKIDALIAKQQRLIALLEEKRQAVISHAVTKGLDPTAPLRPSGIDWLGDVPAHWEVMKLKYPISVKGGYAFSSESFTEMGKKVIRIGDIDTRGVISLQDAKCIPSNAAKQFSAYEVTAGHILMAMTGATIGKAGWYTDSEPALLNQRVGAFECDNEKISSRFFWYVLKSEGYQQYVTLTAFGGAQPNISDTQMLDYSIVLPKMVEQQNIADFLDMESTRFDALSDKARAASDLLRERRTALVSAAVTGKIDLRGWQVPSEASDSIQIKEVMA